MILSAENFEKEVLKAKEVVVVLFHLNTCPFCRAFMPLFDAAIRKQTLLINPPAKIRFEKAELSDYDSPLWETYVPNDTVPTVVAFKDGKQLARLEGKPQQGISEQEFKDFLKNII